MTRKSALTIATLASVLWGALGTVGVVPALFSVMMFDAPGSTTNPATIASAASVMSFPLVCGISVSLCWTRFREQRFAAAGWSTLLPLMNVVVLAAAIGWIEWMQGGKLNG